MALALGAGAAFVLIGSSLMPLGLVMALALAVASVVGHRVAMAATSFVMIVGPWSAFFVLSALHIGFAAFLVWRANRLDNTA